MRWMKFREAKLNYYDHKTLKYSRMNCNVEIIISNILTNFESTLYNEYYCTRKCLHITWTILIILKCDIYGTHGNTFLFVSYLLLLVMCKYTLSKNQPANSFVHALLYHTKSVHCILRKLSRDCLREILLIHLIIQVCRRPKTNSYSDNIIIKH